jgi:hypothetical protein
MVVRVSTETEEEFSDFMSEVDKAKVHDIRSSFYFSWASQSIHYQNISATFEPQLSTAKVVKITAVYGKSFVLIICTIYPRALLIQGCLQYRICIYTVRFHWEWTLRRMSVAVLSPSPADPQHTSAVQATYCQALAFETCT